MVITLDFTGCNLRMISTIWYTKNIFSYCLLPFSFCYRLIISIRRYLYQCGLKKIHHFKIPIIVVGNITVGGTGKTPLVIWLAKFLQQQGFIPGIVSRGYGGKASHYPFHVKDTSDPKIVGDEAVLLARYTQCPIVIDPNRVAAVKKLLSDTGCNIIISDDGLQHYALGRDIEIAVVDGERYFGNGFCLPAGPLREPVKRLEEVDLVIVNGKNCLNKNNLNLIPEVFYQVLNPSITISIAELKNKTLHAVAGIGNPSRFFQTLRALGLTVIEHPFPDHYCFKKTDFNFLKENEWVAMTEKDAVKCEAFADKRFWCLRVKPEVSNEFIQQLTNKIKEI